MPVHPDDPIKRAEHEAVMALVDSAAVTDVANGGRWSNPASWKKGLMPNANANVLIPAGVAQIVDFVDPTTLRTVCVDGSLLFDPAQDTGLSVDTLVVCATGSLEMGTVANPIAAGRQAKITIADRGPIDTVWDPNSFSRGLISHGTVEIHGSVKTPFLPLAQAPNARASTLVLTQPPVSWEAGDRILLTGIDPNSNQDELRLILSITGNSVSIAPLLFDHRPPDPALSVYVANLSRNVIIASQNAKTTSQRGHVMFMHSPKVAVRYAMFSGLGRTDKLKRINAPALDSAGKLVAGTGKNPRGRYAMHFHRTGTDFSTPPAVAAGCVVSGSPGWGFVNHDSHVEIVDNVSHNVVGAHFVTEIGNEIGGFRRNLAVRSVGAKESIDQRQTEQDFGIQGDGYWFQGGGVEVDDNIAVGHSGNGFVFFTRGLIVDGKTTVFQSHNLADPSWAGAAPAVQVGHVPIRSFKSNTAFASKTLLQIAYHLHPSVPHNQRSFISDFVGWGAGLRGMFLQYSTHLTIERPVLIGNLSAPSKTAVVRNVVLAHLDVIGPRIEGWDIGIMSPERGVNSIRGGFLNNNTANVLVLGEAGRTLDISGVSYGPLPGHNFSVVSDLAPGSLDPSLIFLRDVVTADGRQIFYHEQMPDSVPFPGGTAVAYIPSELIDLTAQEIWDQYGLAVAGALAPAGAVADPKIENGLIGPVVQSYQRPLTLQSAKYTNKLAYRLVYIDASGVKVAEPTLTQLRDGWNLLTRTVGGQTRTFFVYGDQTPPTFTPLLQSTTVAAANLGRPFRVLGDMHDDSIGVSRIDRLVSLQGLPVQTAPDGSRFVMISFPIKDLAGNATNASWQIKVT